MMRGGKGDSHEANNLWPETTTPLQVGHLLLLPPIAFFNEVELVRLSLLSLMGNMQYSGQYPSTKTENHKTWISTLMFKRPMADGEK